MILANTPERARSARWRNQKPGKTLGAWCTPFFGLEMTPSDGRPAPRVGTLYPVAFEIDFDPGYETRPHFHVADQFQVFVGGSGTVGKTALNPVSLHYAAAYSPYGPLRGGEHGLRYFTLRNGFDTGIHYMPESRDELKAAEQRPRVESADAVADLGAPVDVDAPERSALIGPHADGLAAWFIRLPAGCSVDAPDPAGTGGQHWFVVSGSGALGATPLAAETCAFCTPDEPRPQLRAGADGIALLALQFPAFA